MVTSNSLGNIYESMSFVMGKISAITKSKSNKEQGFKIRGIDDVYNELHPILAEAGIFCAPEVIESSRHEKPTKSGGVLSCIRLRIKYHFYAKDGTSICCVVEGEGMDSGDKATSKAMAIAHKYALLQTFAIPTEETDDPDHETQHPESRPPEPRGATPQPSAGVKNPPALIALRNEAQSLLNRCAELGISSPGISAFEASIMTASLADLNTGIAKLKAKINQQGQK